MIYLDYAAATPVNPEVLATMQPYFSEQFYNPSATYLAGRAVRIDLDGARTKIARIIGARSSEVVLTAGATEANNLAIKGIMSLYPAAEVLVSSIEHESVLVPAREFKVGEVPVNSQGIVDLERLEGMITDQTVLISVMLVNNEIGTIQPLKEIAKLLNKLSNLRRSKNNDLPLFLHTDASQAPLYLDLHVARLGIDLMTINGGKIYGPKQTAALYVRAGVGLMPVVVGGGQEYSIRSGTENVPGAIGLARALELAQQNKTLEVDRLSDLRSDFIKDLTSAIPEAVINGSTKHHAPHIVSVTFPGADNERLMMQLDEAGIQVAVGSACSASNEEPSHVLKAIGLSDKDAQATLRFSFGKNTDGDQLKKVIHALSDISPLQQ